MNNPGDIANANGDVFISENELAMFGMALMNEEQLSNAKKFGWERIGIDETTKLFLVRRRANAGIPLVLKKNDRWMPRKYLPQRRECTNFEFSHEMERGKEFHYKCSVGYYPDGTIGEIFLNLSKHGTSLDVNVQEAAIFASIAIQYGVPLEVLQGAIKRDPEGYPASPLGHALDLIVNNGKGQDNGTVEASTVQEKRPDNRDPPPKPPELDG